MLSVWAASPAISTALCDAWLCDAWWFEAFDGCLRGVAFEPLSRSRLADWFTQMCHCAGSVSLLSGFNGPGAHVALHTVFETLRFPRAE